MPTKIYAFINSGSGRDLIAAAVCSICGDILAEHLSSNEDFAKHDIGVTSDWKHKYYIQHNAEEHQGETYEVEWVSDPANHAGFQELQARLEQGH